jgi:nuclear transport factor 2 (NTF2) superfamily protein
MAYRIFIAQKINARVRKRNLIRNRTKVIEFIKSKDDSDFEKSYRLPKRIFYYLLEKIRPKLETKYKWPESVQVHIWNLKFY